METALATVRDNEPHGTYGYSFMHCAVGGQTAADRSKAGACDELKSYLKVPLVTTGDVVGWWGVSSSFLL